MQLCMHLLTIIAQPIDTHLTLRTASCRQNNEAGPGILLLISLFHDGSIISRIHLQMHNVDQLRDRLPHDNKIQSCIEIIIDTLVTQPQSKCAKNVVPG